MAHIEPPHPRTHPQPSPTLVPRGAAYEPQTFSATHSQGPPKSLQPYSAHSHSAPPSLGDRTPKSLPSRTVSVPPQHSATSVASLENARYRQGEVPQSEHPNEDRHFILDDGYCRVFAVFDGHDGPRAAGFASNFFIQYFSSESWKAVVSLSPHAQREQIPIALKEFFKAAEKEFFHSIRHHIEERNQLQRTIPQVCLCCRLLKNFLLMRMYEVVNLAVLSQTPSHLVCFLWTLVCGMFL